MESAHVAPELMKKLLFLTIIAASLFSCGRARKAYTPQPEFTAYISAYTGGMISSAGGSIRIELAGAVPGIEAGAPVGEKLFSFSPSIKGEARWVSGNAVEFIPREGALKPGVLYNAEFRLGKIEKVEKGLETFRFSFRTKGLDFEIRSEQGVITRGNPMVMSQRGTVIFGDMVDAGKVADMLTLDGKRPASVEPAEGKASEFRFSFDNLQRPSGDDETLTLRAKGKAVGIDRAEEATILVPAAGRFRFVDAVALNAPAEGLSLQFSEPLDAAQDLRGLVEITGVEDYSFQIEENIIKVFFQTPGQEEEITVDVSQGVRSDSGEKLDRDVSASIQAPAGKPAVEILSKGNIMPDSEELLLAFRALSLNAVDVKIIRIFESNVLMFLQTNTLASSGELRRSGRMVCEKTLQLPAGGQGGWQDYSVDLAPLVRQEPGAIYRVELSFRREYSTYACGGAAAVKSPSDAEGVVVLRADDFDPASGSEWDEPEPYWWDSDGYDYGEYNWRERDDPCRPTYYMQSDRRAGINVMASNLGVIAKSGDGRNLFVAVADILTTEPVADASIKVYNYQLQRIGSGKTGSDGQARVEVGGTPFAAVVEKGRAKTYVRLVDNEQNSLSRFDVGGKQIQKGLKGFVYGERGVWRPGDTIYLTAVVEDRLGRIPGGHPVTLELFNARGQFHARQVNAHGVGGFYCFTVPTAEGDPTGVWNAYVKMGGASFHKALRVETVKPNRLKIKFDVRGGRIDGSALSTPASMDASWLTGAVARNLKASVEMSLVRGAASPFKGFERFVFNNPASAFTSEKSEVWSGSTDAAGHARMDIKTPSADNAPGVMRADVVCRVFEPGGDASIYAESFPFSPFSRYVGVDLGQRSGDYFETDKDLAFDIVTVDAAGKPVDGRVDYKIYKLSWSWWWEKGDESLESYVNGNYASPVDQGSLATAMGRGRITFRVDYPEWGRYLVYVKDSNGGHASGGIVYVDWPSWRGRSGKDDPDGASMLTFSTDSKSYEVGRTATVIIPQSAGGRALVSLENGSTVLRSEWVEMDPKGDTKYTFKVTEAMAPNFYIHISLLRPHEQTANSLPIRLYGVQPVEVENGASKLEPVIAAPDVLRPETAFTVKVSEKSGRAMTYTLAVVDEGLLDLTNFRTPDPWKEFYAREALGVRTWDVYDYVMGAFGGRMGALLGIGGDEDIKPGDRKASRFKPVVRFLGPFKLGKGGSNSHKVSLPMYVGSVRVMVVAGSGAAYGKADKAIPVRAPLMVLPTLPRVASTGEDIVLPVNVFAMEPGVRNVTVKVQVDGSLSVADGAQRTLAFEKPSDGMVYFRLKAAASPGRATVRVTASGGGHSASETIEITVRNPNPPSLTVIDTMMAAGSALQLPYSLDGTSGPDNSVRLEVASMPSVDLTRRYDYLSDYQHLCSEQLVSRGLPMLYLSVFREVDGKEAEKIKDGVNAIIRQLYGRQLSNGSVVYWPGSAEGNDWITSYAGNFLWEASQRGYEVDAGVLSRWKEYQRRTALSWSMPRNRDNRYYSYYQPDVVQAYRLYTLALAGAPETGAMNRLRETPGVSTSAKWRLAGAYALAGKRSAAREVVAEIKNTRETYGYTWGCGYTYGSEERDAAMILEAMVAMGDMAEAVKQARSLSRMLSAEEYLSTQSTSFALAAMGSLAARTTSGQVDCVWEAAGRQGSLRTAKAVGVSDVPVTGRGAIEVRSRSKGDLYVTLVTRTQPLVDDRPAMSAGITLSVEYTDAAGRAVKPDSLGQGTDLTAVVTVTNATGSADLTDLALTHIFPSGWEIFNDRMALSDQAMDAAGQARSGVRAGKAPAYVYQDIRDDRVLTYFGLLRGQSKTFTVRLQAAYAGRFVLPAVQCEDMYDPSVRARTAAGWVVVR